MPLLTPLQFALIAAADVVYMQVICSVGGAA